LFPSGTFLKLFLSPPRPHRRFQLSANPPIVQHSLFSKWPMQGAIGVRISLFRHFNQDDWMLWMFDDNSFIFLGVFQFVFPVFEFLGRHTKNTEANLLFSGS
jgi:hypothetical protein